MADLTFRCCERPEVSAQHGHRRREREVRGRHAANVGSLVGGEVEESVAGDWASDRSAELIAVQAVAAAPAVGANRGERVDRVQRIVAEELEAAAVNDVRPGFRDGVDDGGGVMAVLRGERARLDLDLLERFGERERHRGVVVRTLWVLPSSTYAVPFGKPPATAIVPGEPA